MTEIEMLKVRVKSLEKSLHDANTEICELCEQLGQDKLDGRNMCDECDWCYWKDDNYVSELACRAAVAIFGKNKRGKKVEGE